MISFGEIDEASLATKKASCKVLKIYTELNKQKKRKVLCLFISYGSEKVVTVEFHQCGSYSILVMPSTLETDFFKNYIEPSISKLYDIIELCSIQHRNNRHVKWIHMFYRIKNNIIKR